MAGRPRRETRPTRLRPTRLRPSRRRPAGETRGGPDPAAQARRRAAREKKVSLGLDALQTFLKDLVRDGLAQAAARPYSDWDTQAARLVDAQAPGAARLVRMIPEVLPHPDRLLTHLSRLYLLTEAWPRRDTLSAPQQADLRAALGFPLDRAATVAAGGTDTRWLILGHTVSDEEHVRTRRTWLHEGGTTALLLDFAAPGWPLLPPLPAGGSVRARLSPAPGTVPQRHVLDGEATRSATTPLPAPVNLDGLLDAHGAALALNPWLERTAHHLGPVTVHPPARDGDPWRAGDARGSLPLGGSDTARLTLLALGGGHPQTFTAEWDGQSLTPLCAGRTAPCTRWMNRRMNMGSDLPALLSAALIGTERAPLPTPGPDAAGQAAARVTRDDPAGTLLARAALLTLAATAGRQPDPPAPTPTPPPPIRARKPRPAPRGTSRTWAARCCTSG
ncbi:hypothetical protein ACFOLM_17025 [Deinococcus soli (ex Cha et al. 2016)]|uniref:hypothetical protein n=1 Tax=Deinococcus soli (ex Cha et al. 2016) TaxID=1309411 RepID=UPI003611F136